MKIPRGRARVPCGFVVAGLLWLAGVAPGLCAEKPLAAPEPMVKAAFLLNFARLCDWPTNSFAAADTPLVIGVLGNDPVATALESSIAGKTVQGRKVRIERYQRADQIENCQILFIGKSARDQMLPIIRQLGNRPVLTVSDQDGFAERGGVIRLFEQDQRLRFAINTNAAKRAGIALDSGMMNLGILLDTNPSTKSDEGF